MLTFLKQRSGAIFAPFSVFCKNEGQHEGFILKPVETHPIVKHMPFIAIVFNNINEKKNTEF